MLCYTVVDRSVVPVPKLDSAKFTNKKRAQEPEDAFEEVSTIRGKVSVSRDGHILIMKPDGQIQQVIGEAPTCRLSNFFFNIDGIKVV